MTSKIETALYTTDFQEAMAETKSMARKTGALLFLYDEFGIFTISSGYKENVLFSAYPGGRTQVTLTGTQYL